MPGNAGFGSQKSSSGKQTQTIAPGDRPGAIFQIFEILSRVTLDTNRKTNDTTFMPNARGERRNKSKGLNNDSVASG
jgi:hypothetical protein